jgi:hypothetical protein
MEMPNMHFEGLVHRGRGGTDCHTISPPSLSEGIQEFRYFDMVIQSELYHYPWECIGCTFIDYPYSNTCH